MNPRLIIEKLPALGGGDGLVRFVAVEDLLSESFARKLMLNHLHSGEAGMQDSYQDALRRSLEKVEPVERGVAAANQEQGTDA